MSFYNDKIDSITAAGTRNEDLTSGLKHYNNMSKSRSPINIQPKNTFMASNGSYTGYKNDTAS